MNEIINEHQTAAHVAVKMMRPMAIKLMINVLCNFNLRELYDKLHNAWTAVHYGTPTSWSTLLLVLGKSRGNQKSCIVESVKVVIL